MKYGAEDSTTTTVVGWLINLYNYNKTPTSFVFRLRSRSVLAHNIEIPVTGEKIKKIQFPAPNIYNVLELCVKKNGF